MVANTVSQNQKTGLFEQYDEVWLFGYGSLIYKADFPWLERKPAHVYHWARRFWQGSHDHRGTLEAPGRVVTLVKAPKTQCVGVAYRISPAVFAHLDYREKNGYLRKQIDIYFDHKNLVEGLVYVASEQNSAFLGPQSELEIAKQIALSQGPSGHNKDYLFALANALREMQAFDEHVFAVEQHLLRICNKGNE